MSIVSATDTKLPHRLSTTNEIIETENDVRNILGSTSWTYGKQPGLVGHAGQFQGHLGKD